MARKTFKEEPAKKSPWLNSNKKREEKVLKPIYPVIKGEVICPQCNNVNVVETNAERVKDYPRDRFYTTITCPCGELITGWIYVDSE